MENITSSLNNRLSDSSAVAADDRPLSPVLNSSGSSQKAIYNRKRSRPKTKVNLIDRFALEQTTSSTQKTKHESISNFLINPKLLDNFNVGDKIKKIKEIEEARRKFATHFYINPVSSNECKPEVPSTSSSVQFKKPISPIVRKQISKSNCDTYKNQDATPGLQFEQVKNSRKEYDKPIFEGFLTGSGKKVIVSFESIKKHSALFEDILTPVELKENLNKSILGPKEEEEGPKVLTNSISQNVKKSQINDIGNKTILHTSISDTQFNLAGDIALSVDFESWTNAEFDTFISTNKENKKIVTSVRCEEDFKGFCEPLTENQLEHSYTTLIKHVEEKISLILNKTNFPCTTNKRSLSPFITNPCKRFKFDTESSPHLACMDLMCNESEMKTKVHLKSRDSKNYLNEASNILKEDNLPLSEKLHKDDLSEILIPIKNEFSSTSAISIKPMGFQTASGKGIQISNKAWGTASNILQEESLPDFDKSKLMNREKFAITHGKNNQVVNKVTIEKSTTNEYCFKNKYLEVDSLNPASVGSTVENKLIGFQTASGKGIQVSNKALSRASNILQEKNLPSFNENNSNKNVTKDSSRKISHENNETSAHVDEWIKATTFINDNSNIGNNFTSGFSSASGKKLQISSKAWNRASNVLKEDNLPAIGENQIKSNEMPECSSNQGFSVGGSVVQKENFPHIAEHQIKNRQPIKTNLYDNISSTNTKSYNSTKEEIFPKNADENLQNELLMENPVCQSGNMFSGFISASGSNIHVTKNSWMKANTLLNDDNLIKSENKSQTFSECSNKDLKLSYEDLNSLSHKKELPSVSKRKTMPANEAIAIPKKKNIRFISPVKVPSNENIACDLKSTPAKDDKNSVPKLNDLESSVNNLHTPKNDITKSTVTKSSRKRLGVAISKQIVIHKDKIQKASAIFDEPADEKPVFTNVNQLNIYSSTPVKKCGVIGKPNIETFKNENNCLNNLNITPIRNANAHRIVKKEVEVETKIDLVHDQDGAIILKKCNTLNSLEHINSEYESLEMQLQNLLNKKQVLDSQRGFLTNNKNCSHISAKQGVLTKKRSSQQRVSWSHYLDSVKPGSITTSEALENGVSSVVLAVSPNNANDVHFNCDRNEQNKSIVHTEDGAIVVSNSKNLIGLTEIITAFEVMPGIDAKLLPRNWISNHFKWIVWKLASLERNFPDKFANYLCVENLIQQLKYRYDKEIDNAERPALRKILEKDDVPQKKMVLCVAGITEVSPDYFELELTDGWYSIRTIIDRPLCKQVKMERIVVGTKLITQCAELLNCDDGCHPLEVFDNVRLKIFYNCTRRAKWNSKLGYQKVLEPFPISLHTVLPDGGCIGCIKVFIARVYPIGYMEKEINGRAVFRNKRAEDKKAQEWENERARAIEAIRHKVQREYETEALTDISKCKISLNKQSLHGETHSPAVLFEMLQSTNDPEGFKSMLSSDQLAQVMKHEINFHYQQQQELFNRMDMEIRNFKFQSRNVTPVLKLCVTQLHENNEQSEIGYTFNIYKPTEDHLQSITEGSTFFIYNVLPKHNGEIVANNKTHFKLETTLVKVNKASRTIIPISSLCQTKKPMFNEFDTIGTIVRLHKSDNSQNIWLTDFVGNLLLVKVVVGPDKCSILDNLTKGHSIAISNLIFCTPKYCFEQAIANQSTLVTRYPRHSLLQEHLLVHSKQLPKDLTQLMNECDKKIEKFEAIVDSSKSYKNSTANSLIEPTNLCNLFDDSYADTTEIAMSLIDMDQYFDSSIR